MSGPSPCSRASRGWPPNPCGASGHRPVAPRPVVLGDHPQDVDPEPVDAAREPEPEVVEHRRPHRGVAPVQVRLLRQERVIPVLAGRLVERPGRAAELGNEVVGRAAVGRRIAPHVPVAMRGAARRARVEEPRVVRRGVVGDEVQQDPDPALVCRGDQRVEVRQGAEHGIDVAVVGDVVAEVAHRRPEDRRQPDGVDAEPGEVVQPADQAPQVTDAVPVRVRERPRIDLVDDALLPPRGHGVAQGTEVGADDVTCRRQLLREDDHPAVGLLADRLGRDVAVVAQREVDPAALEGRHRLQLEHLAGLGDALRGAGREVDELALAAPAIVLDVDEHAGPLAGPAREHQVHEVLEGRQALALAADERPEGLAVRAVADDVEPAGLALADLDRDAFEAEVAHQRLEDLATRGERLGRGLRGLELGPLHGERPAGGGHRGDLCRRELRAAACRGRAIVTPGRAVAVVAARGPSTGPVVAARGPVALRGGHLRAVALRRPIARGGRPRGRSPWGRSP